MAKCGFTHKECLKDDCMFWIEIEDDEGNIKSICKFLLLEEESPIIFKEDEESEK